MKDPMDVLDQYIEEPSAADDVPEKKQPIQKLNYTHEACIDLIIANRGISQNRLAATFGYSPSWISTIMQSDAFKDRLQARIAEIVDPALTATVNQQLEGILARSMELLREKLSSPEPPDNLILRSIELSTRALGLGVKAPVVTINNTTMNNHLDSLGGRLVALLDRKKVEAQDPPLLEQSQ
jgi:transcriptional regulator with XRE-family HTH domain